MTSAEAIARLKGHYDGWNAPSHETALSNCGELLDGLPEVCELYRDHNGSQRLPRRGDKWLPVRLLPLEQLGPVQAALESFTSEVADIGRIVWLWADDGSNYAGAYATGRLRGWLVKLDHEEPVLAPAFRSTDSFLNRLVECASDGDSEVSAFDLTMVPGDVPSVQQMPDYDESDRALAAYFTGMHDRESDPDKRRLYAMCAITLTPCADTAALAPFLREDDMWVPEMAVSIMRLRGCEDALEEVERLAREGRLNGSLAAMSMLVRLDSPGAQAAVKRLMQQLPPDKMNYLEQVLRRSSM